MYSGHLWIGITHRIALKYVLTYAASLVPPHLLDENSLGTWNRWPKICWWAAVGPLTATFSSIRPMCMRKGWMWMKDGCGWSEWVHHFLQRHSVFGFLFIVQFGYAGQARPTCKCRFGVVASILYVCRCSHLHGMILRDVSIWWFRWHLSCVLGWKKALVLLFGIGIEVWMVMFHVSLTR
jgi:hypothetical protein